MKSRASQIARATVAQAGDVETRRRPTGTGWRRGAPFVAAAVVLLAGLCAGPVREGRAAAVTAEKLEATVGRLVAQIRYAQSRNGSWGGGALAVGQWVVGQTSLAVLALSSAGAPPGDEAVARGVQYLLGHGTDSVYEMSLKIMALESVDKERYRAEIEKTTRSLIRSQHDSGGWSYNGRGSRPDNSNSQFAVLALRSAALSGVAVPEEVWRKAWEYFARGQRRDGGWGYLQSGGAAYGSMTVAGVASLYICAARLHVAGGQCGRYPSDRRVETGLAWLAKNFSVTVNPRRRGYKFYYLYGLERAGAISARRYLGRHDWYREGAEHLVGDPAALKGRAVMNSSLLRDCFALLFLAKGNSPVLVHKARWTGAWNAFRYDADFLVERFGQLLGQRVTWQIMPLDSPLDHLKAAPVLYVSGRGELAWTALETRRFLEYVRSGGFVFAEASGGDEAFDRSFRRLLAEQLPGEELSALPKNHAVYTSYYDLPAEARSRLETVGGPCWTSVLYAPDGLSCAWDVADHEHPDFKLGVNVLAYVTGMETLAGKLRQLEELATAPPAPSPNLRGAFVVGQLVHGGNWRPHTQAWARVLARVNREAGVELFGDPVAIDPDQDSLFRAQLVNIIGVRAFELSEEAKARLRQYVERGGFIFAEAACGSEEFDRSFRALVADVFLGSRLEVLPAGHPLWKLGRPLGSVRYSKLLRDREPGLNRPMLEFVELDGRAVVVYSKFDISSAIAGHPGFQYPAVLEPSASQLMLKVVLYALAG